VRFAHDLVDENLNDLSWWTEKHNRYAVREAADLLKETLIYSVLVIASAAKQSMPHKESTTYGSPRRCAPRDDGINQRFLN